MSGTGNDGLDLNLHNSADKKNFYGLVKKKQVAEQEQQQADQALATQPEEKPAIELLKINNIPVNEPEEKAVEPAIATMDIIDKRAGGLFGNAAEPQNLTGMTRKTFTGNPAPSSVKPPFTRSPEPEPVSAELAEETAEPVKQWLVR